MRITKRGENWDSDRDDMRYRVAMTLAESGLRDVSACRQEIDQGSRLIAAGHDWPSAGQQNVEHVLDKLSDVMHKFAADRINDPQLAGMMASCSMACLLAGIHVGNISLTTKLYNELRYENHYKNTVQHNLHTCHELLIQIYTYARDNGPEGSSSAA